MPAMCVGRAKMESWVRCLGCGQPPSCRPRLARLYDFPRCRPRPLVTELPEELFGGAPWVLRPPPQCIKYEKEDLGGNPLPAPRHIRGLRRRYASSGSRGEVIKTTKTKGSLPPLRPGIRVSDTLSSPSGSSQNLRKTKEPPSGSMPTQRRCAIRERGDQYPSP